MSRNRLIDNCGFTGGRHRFASGKPQGSDPDNQVHGRGKGDRALHAKVPEYEHRTDQTGKRRTQSVYRVKQAHGFSDHAISADQMHQKKRQGCPHQKGGNQDREEGGNKGLRKAEVDRLNADEFDDAQRSQAEKCNRNLKQAKQEKRGYARIGRKDARQPGCRRQARA